MRRSIINEQLSLFEAEHEAIRKAEEQAEADEEQKAYEMDVAAQGWAEDAAELWIPAKYPPVKDGIYLTIESKGKRRFCLGMTAYDGKNWHTYHEGAYVSHWLPLPEWE